MESIAVANISAAASSRLVHDKSRNLYVVTHTFVRNKQGPNKHALIKQTTILLVQKHLQGT